MSSPPSDITLPTETLYAIFRLLSPPTLSALSCVSFRFNAIAERLLYTSIAFSEILTESSPIPRKTLRWCDSLLERPHLFHATKRVSIRWHSDPRSPPPRHLTTPVVKLADLLHLLTHLDSLELFLGPANLGLTCLEPIHAVERVVRGCSFPWLQYCSLGAEWCKGVQGYTGVLSAFLASLPSLRHLKLADHHHSASLALDVPQTALPFLTSFRGTPDTAASLLPGRPVQHLFLIGQDSDVNGENLLKFTKTSVPLRFLDLSAMSVRPILLRNVATYLPMVEGLKFKLALRHTLHYAMSGIRLLTGLSAVLSAFTQLTYLEITPTDINDPNTPDADAEYALCREWERACPTLRRIIFPTQSEWTLVADERIVGVGAGPGWMLVRHP
ncbi:hypothetical protein AX16_009341 [Volvariella volvacea WC 439]|nr:hypothetical protein AX16_009341 [Volvariella volvacea WC 439]